MNRQILRFYVFVLTLLEISLNSKLTAQGKSHGKIDSYFARMRAPSRGRNKVPRA